MKKTLSIILAAGLLTATLAGFAVATDDEGEGGAPPPQPYYLSVTGTIVSIGDLPGQEGVVGINIEDTYDNPATLITTENTVYPFESEFAVGDTVTGYYLANAPMIMIWPPQYTIAVLAVGMPADSNIKVDRFYTWDDHTDGYLLAQDGQFAFRAGEDTVIVLANGDDFSDGDIEGRRMIVIYDVSTRSIPELATALKVIVLYEDIMPLSDNPLDTDIDATGWPILVNGKQIDAPEAFQTEDGFVMVPLRAVAEELGFDVQWDASAAAVSLNGTIKLAIGNPSYQIGDSEFVVVAGAPAPTLVVCYTYVPLLFFRDVLEMPNTFAFEGVIEIHSEGEAMQ